MRNPHSFGELSPAIPQFRVRGKPARSFRHANAALQQICGGIAKESLA
jgi:hypothetical protein